MRFYDLILKSWEAVPRPLRTVYYKLSGKLAFGDLFLPDRSEVVTVRSGILRGLKMRLNIKRERGYLVGSHETDTQEGLRRIVKEGMTVFNIGTHIGFFTLALCRLAGPAGKVIAFEPNPSVRRRLAENVSLNGYGDIIKIEEYAVGDYTGDAVFSLSLSDTQGRFADLPYVKPGSDIKVKCVTLDSYTEMNRIIPDLIFMDVEHAEGKVLRGGEKLLPNSKPLLFIEMHGDKAIGEAWEELKKNGYLLYSLPGFSAVDSCRAVSYGQYFAAHWSFSLNRQFV